MRSLGVVSNARKLFKITPNIFNIAFHSGLGLRLCFKPETQGIPELEAIPLLVFVFGVLREEGSRKVCPEVKVMKACPDRDNLVSDTLGRQILTPGIRSSPTDTITSVCFC